MLEASTGEEAISLLKDNHIDLVILDLMLPGIDGYEVRAILGIIILIRLLLWLQLKAVIWISAGLELGADDYVVKPFNTYD